MAALTRPGSHAQADQARSPMDGGHGGKEPGALPQQVSEDELELGLPEAAEQPQGLHAAFELLPGDGAQDRSPDKGVEPR